MSAVPCRRVRGDIKAEVAAMKILKEGDKVRLKPDAPLLCEHPELAGAMDVVSSIVKGPQWGRLASSPAERGRDVKVHVRFAAPVNLVVLNVEVGQFEGVDQIEPRLRLV